MGARLLLKMAYADGSGTRAHTAPFGQFPGFIHSPARDHSSAFFRLQHGPRRSELVATLAPAARALHPTTT